MVVASVAARPSIDARALGSAARIKGGRLATARRGVFVPTKTRASPGVFAGDAGGMKVAVAGAGGRTGSLVVKRLAESASFAPPKGLVRSSKSADKLRKALGDLPAELVQGDVSDANALADLCAGCDALVILTSAVPKPRLASIALALVSKLLPFMENRRPEFFFPEGGSPETVDWLGQKAQVDAALSGGVRKIVLVSSMGGTQVDNFLNTMGAGGAVGEANILLWKRKAEMYLIEKCSETNGKTSFVIVHPGGLLDKPGGERELLVGVDDALLDGDRRSVPRADVAEMVVKALEADAIANVSFDLASREPGEGEAPPKSKEDFSRLVASLGGSTADYAKPRESPVPLP
jgi:uncharacterized protein YbjT (DUF2867 family)